MILKRKLFVIGLALVCFLLGSNHIINAGEVVLAKDGVALHSIVLGSNASERTVEAAMSLAEYLGRITGGNFSLTVGDGTEGVAVGTYKDFPQLGLEDLFNSETLTRRDEYLLRTHNKGIYLVGATDLAAQHAVWGFLFELGYRQFFPTDSWEIIPEKQNLKTELDSFEKPDFYNRIGPNYAPWSDRKLWKRWHDRNRMTSSLMVDTGHSYGGIIRRNKAAFNEHPEYLALVNGVRGESRAASMKFCISNEGLRHLVVEDAIRRVEAKPEVPSIRMDPSDGGDWCECEACAKMGSVSDRVVILSNEVAEAINNIGYGEKYVGIYAYFEHSPPPTIDVHPKVVVSIATDFMKRGWTLEELIEGWSKYTVVLGIREYHDVFKWSFGLPHKARGGDVNYLIENIPYFYSKGARFMNSESSDTWGVNGLGYYLSGLLLWDVSAADRVDEIINDFVEKSFSEAYVPMRKFFYMINQDYVTPRSSDDLLAHMYGYINEARKLTKDSKALIRLDELSLYTRYIELWFKYKSLDKADPGRDKAAQDLYRYAYRMQNTMMVNMISLQGNLRRSGINVPKKRANSILVGRKLEDMEPWHSSKLFTDDEIAQFIADGIGTYQKDKIEFVPVAFSENLEPAAEVLRLRKVSYGDMGDDNSFLRSHKMFTWFKPDSKQLSLEVTGGIIERYRHAGNVKFELFSPQEVMVEAVDANVSVPPDGKPHPIILTSPYDGLHQLEWSDGGARTRLSWPVGQPMTAQADMKNPQSLGRNFRLYFYVPKGTKIVGGHTSSNKFQMFDSNSNSVLDLRKVEGGEGYFNVHVPQGQDGTLWEMRGYLSTVMLLTVPPYLARNEKELLLPKEVIEADK